MNISIILRFSYLFAVFIRIRQSGRALREKQATVTGIKAGSKKQTAVITAWDKIVKNIISKS